MQDELSLELYLENIHKIVSNPYLQEIWRLTPKIAQAIREYLDDQGFIEFIPPILGPVTDPGTRGANLFTVDYYGKTYTLMRSAILYKQLLASSIKEGKIYFFSPNFRQEPLDSLYSKRHLVEFIQVDVEIYNATHFEAMNVAEELFTYVCEKMKQYEDRLRVIWEYFKSDRKELKVPKKPFKKMKHKEVIDFLKNKIKEEPKIVNELKEKFNVKDPISRLNYNSELTWEWEWYLSQIIYEPIFIYDYPRGARGFYDREYSDNPNILMDFDLIVPGHGEIVSGAAREYKYEKVLRRMRDNNENPAIYGWYIKFLKEVEPPTAGFGIGFERLIKYICDLPDIRFTRPYPKLPGFYAP